MLVIFMKESLQPALEEMYSQRCNLLHMDETYWPAAHEYSGNCIVSSLFHNLETELYPKSLGLKYVASGEETYYINGKRHAVSAGKYLLVNQTMPTLEVVIKEKDTLGICVNIEGELLNDVLQQLVEPDNPDAAANFRQFCLSPELLVREVTAGPEMKLFMNRLVRASYHKSYSGPPLELVFELTVLLVKENLDLVSSYFKLRTSKISTRKELFQRLLLGKAVLDDSVFSSISIKEVAETSCLSEFHFYRLFRQCF
ncbi:MAG TPA: AraC family ligand binding domain-containing protein, partial [Adhaeribacter sp.]|nr:AraC family ligand binding domain-containing protein [Adhaeribacter sp.]